MPQKAHTFTKFDDDLNRIRSSILEMASLIEMQFRQSIQAFLDTNTALARQVIELDYSVNQLESRIDELCVIALARQQPAASDLRSIVISMKFIVHLERIGDEAKKIARTAERLAQQNHLSKLQLSSIHIDAELAQIKLAGIIESFARLDTQAAHKLLDTEDLINEEFNTILKSLIQSMSDDPRTISTSLDILFVAKSIERIGDHIKDMSKLVIDASNRYNEI